MARGTNRQETRKVSFSRKHMPGARSRPPGHRMSASPSRSCLRNTSSPAPAQPSTASGPSYASTVRTGAEGSARHIKAKAYRGRSRLLRESSKVSADILWPLTQHLEWTDPAELDSLICQKIYELISKILRFASHFQPVREDSRDESACWRLISSSKHVKTVRYIGYLALAGKDGVDAWNRLLTQPQSLQALVLAIVGHVLKHHVFGVSWFGKRESDERFFGKISTQLQQEDGFYRSASRARRCQQHNASDGRQAASALADLEMAQERLAGQLLHLVLPLHQSRRRGDRQTTATTLLYPKALEIVVAASTLSRQMRMEPDVAFEWSDIWKGAKFDTQHMEAVNLGQMLETSPYVKDASSQYVTLRDGALVEQSEPIVQVVAFPGLTVYRRGSAPTRLDDGTVREPDLVRLGEREKDLIARRITKSVVLLQWGKQTLAARLAGSSAWNDAVKSGDMSRFAEPHEGVAELADLFIQCHGPRAFEV